jgi:hypothetical protein
MWSRGVWREWWGPLAVSAVSTVNAERSVRLPVRTIASCAAGAANAFQLDQRYRHPHESRDVQ